MHRPWTEGGGRGGRRRIQANDSRFVPIETGGEPAKGGIALPSDCVDDRGDIAGDLVEIVSLPGKQRFELRIEVGISRVENPHVRPPHETLQCKRPTPPHRVSGRFG